MLGDIFKDGYKNSATFKMELFAAIGNLRAYNQWIVVFAVALLTQPSLQVKSKS